MRTVSSLSVAERDALMELSTISRIDAYVIDASEMRLPVGHIPRAIATHRGNGRPFIFMRVDDCGTLHYHQEGGCITLKVFND